MEKKSLLKLLVCSALTLGISAPVMAAANTGTENLQAFNLDNMVVTATRTLKEIQQVPASVSVVTAKEIEEKNITSVRDAISQVPGVFINRKGNDDNITMRGFTTENILVLVDGQAINNPYKGEVKLNDISVDSIKKIEVLRGAASSIYGGRAVGGVISITTKEAEEFGTHGSAVLGQGTYNTWRKSVNLDTKSNEKISFGFNAEQRSSDGFRGFYRSAKKDKKKKDTEAGVTDIEANLPKLSDGAYVYGGRGEKVWSHESYGTYAKYNFDENKSLKYNFKRVKGDYHYANPFTYVYDKDGNPVWKGIVKTQDGTTIKLSPSKFYGYYGEDETDYHTLTFADAANNVNVLMAYSKDRKDGFSSNDIPKDYNDVDWDGEGELSNHPTKVANIDITKAWENVGGKHNIVVGASYKEEKMTQYRNVLTHWRDLNSISDLFAIDEGKVKNKAVFLQDEYKISEPLTIYAGLRYDHFEKGEGSFWSKKKGKESLTKSESESYDELSPKLALDYGIDENTNIYASYGHSFTTPRLYNIYRYSGSVWANPGLDPEKSDTYEIGLKKKIGDKTQVSVNAYRIKTEDKVEYTKFYKMGKLDHKMYINYGEEKRKGVEFELNHVFDKHFSTYLNYAWQNGKVSGPKLADTNKKGYSDVVDYEIPKHIFHAGIQYTQDRWSLLADCEYVSRRQNAKAPTDEYGSEDAYFLVNTALNYEIGRGFDFQFAVNNLLDKEYFCSEACAGRTFTGTLRYNF